MRINIYFKADAKNWWSDEIRTYDGQTDGDWITYQGKFFESPLGVPFIGDLDLGDGGSALHFRNLKLQIVLH